jgi:molybdenum cofactor cytidylyltransferase
MADFHGQPMICRALAATEGLFSRRVVVTRHESVANLCREQNVDVILHALPHRNDTVRLGLEALGDCDCCIFLPGDQPLLSRETLTLLLDAWKHAPDRIVRPVCEDQPGSPVLFPSWAFPELKNPPEGMGGNGVIRQHPTKVLPVPISNPYELTDADTPEILETLKGLCHEI